MRLLLLGALLLLSGCQDIIQPSATSAQLEAARVFAAYTIALLPESDTPTPPGPVPPGPVPPLPDTICDNCGGDGELGDGRIVIECPVCDGTGRITFDLALSRANDRVASLTQRLDKLASDKIDDANVLKSLSTSLALLKQDSSLVSSKCSNLEAELASLRKPKTVTATVTKTPIGAPIAWIDNGPEAKRLAAQQNRPVFVYFTMTGCSFCQRIDRRCFSDPTVADYIAANFIPVKFNQADVPKKILEQWDVYSFPAFRAVNPSWTKYSTVKLTAEADRCLAELADVLQWAATSRRTKSTIEHVFIQRPQYSRPVYSDSAAQCFGGSCTSGSCY